MRLAIVIPAMGPGGAERVTATLANAWAEAAHEVHLITIDPAAPFYPLDARISLHSMDMQGESGSLRAALIGNARRIHALRRILGPVRPDVVLGMMTSAAVIAIAAGRTRRLPVIAVEHNYPPRLPLGTAWEQARIRSYPFAHRVAMLTSEGADWLRTTIPRARGVVIPNPVQYPLPESSGGVDPGAVLGPQRQVLLAVGRLVPQKGFDLLIEAFARIAADRPAWDLVIVGAGLEDAALKDRASRLGLAERIVLPGNVGNIPAWYRRASLFVLSSRFEGFPMTLMEAMSYGRPAVAFDCDTGPRDLIRDGVDGVLVRPPENPAALADALSRVMADGELRQCLGDAAVSVRERYSLASVLDRWDQVFASLG